MPGLAGKPPRAIWRWRASGRFLPFARCRLGDRLEHLEIGIAQGEPAGQGRKSQLGCAARTIGIEEQRAGILVIDDTVVRIRRGIADPEGRCLQHPKV